MARCLRTSVLLGLAAVLLSLGGASAQQTNEQLAARCSELGAIFYRGPALLTGGLTGTHFVLYWVGPIVGGIIAALVYHYGFMKREE